jgi:hypothetical protein
MQRKDLAWIEVESLRSFWDKEGLVDPRLSWYKKDTLLLEQLLYMDKLTLDDQKERFKWFFNWDWDKELSSFWSISYQWYQYKTLRKVIQLFKDEPGTDVVLKDMKAPPVPLFSNIVAEYFIDRTPLFSIEHLCGLAKSVLQQVDTSTIERLFSVSLPHNNAEEWNSWPLWNNASKFSNQIPNEWKPSVLKSNIPLPINKTIEVDNVVEDEKNRRVSFSSVSSNESKKRYSFKIKTEFLMHSVIRCFDVVSEFDRYIIRI